MTRTSRVWNVLLFLCCYRASIALAQDDYEFADDGSPPFTDDIYGFYNGYLTVPCLPERPGSMVAIRSFRAKDSLSHFVIRSTHIKSNMTKNFEFDFDKVTYDPKKGFTFSNVRNMPVTILCYNKSHTIRPIRFQITLIEPYQLNQPIIRSKSHGHVDVGSPFELICEVRTKLSMFKYSLSWDIKEDNKKPKFSFETVHDDPKYDEVEIGLERLTLYIDRAEKNDSGTYTCLCNVPEDESIFAVATYRLTVSAPYEHYLELDKPIVNKKKGIHIEIGYRGYPPPTLQWLNQSGEKHKKKDPKHIFEYKSSKAILKMLPRVGSYSDDMVLIVSNGKETKKLYFKQSTMQITETQIIVL